MNGKNFKIININGFTAIMLLFFALAAAIFMFVILPTLMIKELWNVYLVNFIVIPEINIVQAGILLAIIFVILFNVFSARFKFSFHNLDVQNDLELDSLIDELSKRDDLSEEEKNELRQNLKGRK